VGSKSVAGYSLGGNNGSHSWSRCFGGAFKEEVEAENVTGIRYQATG